MSSTAAAGKELVVTPNVQHAGAVGQPVLVFQNMSDAQFERALALFAPKPVSKFSIMTDSELTRKLATVAAYLESIQYVRRGGSDVFVEKIVGNQFDSAMIVLLGAGAAKTKERFIVNEWFYDTRGPLPPEIASWDPNPSDPRELAPMPEFRGLEVDWMGHLIELELRWPGFISLFYNSLEMQRTIAEEMARNRTQALYGASSLTSMPAARVGPNVDFVFESRDLLNHAPSPFMHAYHDASTTTARRFDGATSASFLSSSDARPLF